MTDTTDRIAATRQRREERKEQLRAQQEEQEADDFEALDRLEVEHGDSNVAALRVPFSPGSPTMAIVRVPTPPEMKRYRARVKPNKDGVIDAQKGAEELGEAALLYPEGEARERLLRERPGLCVQCGLAALRLGVGREEDDAK